MTRRCSALLVLMLAATAHSAELGKPDPAAIIDAERAMKAFVLPEGAQVDLFAAEPLLGNPVSLTVDNQGRVYVAETYRFGNGVGDNRGHEYWLLDDLAAQTVEDRRAYYKKWIQAGKKTEDWFTQNKEIVRRIVDTDGDGKADSATVFAEGFNDMVDGLAAGVITRGNDVYLTCIPHLWLLRDQNQDGVAENKTSLQDGFGVRTTLIGHDLHGLAWGPDGRLYFSMGDRGYNLKTKEGKIFKAPGSGAVFRCEPDGSNLEVVATGLRNPQELAFDQFGNLWTGDNNSDAGDKARLVYVVEGGETGWHMSYQTMGAPYSRGPWHMDRLWHLRHETQPAWILPPIAHIGGGPSGLTYYPGVGLDERYNHHFFMADFHGAAGNSRIESWTVEPDGAGFNIADDHTFMDKILATDLTFSHDGKLYISDWINGWGGTGKGRIYTLTDPKHLKDPAILEAKKLFAGGFDKQTDTALIKLLAHPHAHVRQAAQFELAQRSKTNDLAKLAQDTTAPRLPRLHAIWALWQIGRRDASAAKPLIALLGDKDVEIRANSTRVLGDLRHAPATSVLLETLRTDSEARVRFFAAIALGRLHHAPALNDLIQQLRENADKDVFLRHACVMGLYGIGDPDALVPFITNPDRSVRLGILLALRRHQDPRIAAFLNDADEFLVSEAARAIHDLPIDAAMPALAKVIDRYITAPSHQPSGPQYKFTVDYWRNLDGDLNRVAGLTQKPDETGASERLEIRKDHADQYGSRITGRIKAPQTGEYRFLMTADDQARLFLSTDESPEHKKVVHEVSTWLPPDQWATSKPVMLEAGKTYYIEAIHKEGGGGDHMIVGWTLPDGTIQRPIGAAGDETGGGDNTFNESLMRRTLSANFRAGTAESVAALADFVANPKNPEKLRLEAMGALIDWAKPGPRDRVLGYHRPLPERDANILRQAISSRMPKILASASGPLEAEAAKFTAQYSLATDPATFLAWVKDPKRPATARIEALRLLSVQNNAKLPEAINAALASDQSSLRAEARQLLATREPARAITELDKALREGATDEKQAALTTLGTLDDPQATVILKSTIDAMLAGKLDAALHLDALDAARARGLKDQVARYETAIDRSDLLAPHRITLQGGNAIQGQQLFENHQAAQCFRCHKVKGVGGGDTGPDLGKISEKGREYILESLVNPSAKIAEGFEMTVLTLKNGSIVAGTVISEANGVIRVAPPAQPTVSVKTTDVSARSSQKISAMPPMGALLKPRELRDMIEYLAQQK